MPGSDRVAGRRKQPESCYTCEDDWEIIHHVSYDPEDTVKVCRSCHGKIHVREGFHDDLDPGIRRPGDFTAEHEKQSTPEKLCEDDPDLEYSAEVQYLADLGVCDSCGEETALAVSDGGELCAGCVDGEELSYVLRAIHRGF